MINNIKDNIINCNGEMINLDNPNQCLSWFLMASYAYYVLHDPIMSDSDFDAISEVLRIRWKDVDHPHKGLITQDHLDASTGYDINFPTIVKHSVRELM